MTTRKSDSNNLLTYSLSEPLNGTTTAQVDINSEAGNLTIDGLTGEDQVLVSGTLQYFEKQGLPTKTLLSGPLPDQGALHGLLERIRDLNLTLISVTSGGPSTQDPDQKDKP